MVVPFKEAVVDPTLPYHSSLDGKMKAVMHSSLKPDEKIKQYNHLLDNFRLGVPERREEAEEVVETPTVQKPRRFKVFLAKPRVKQYLRKYKRTATQKSAEEESGEPSEIPEPAEEEEWVDEVSERKRKKLGAREKKRKEGAQKAQEVNLKKLATGGNFEASLSSLPTTRLRKQTQWYSQQGSYSI